MTASHNIIISYFAKIREQMGQDQDIISVDKAHSIDDIIIHLRSLSDQHNRALNPQNRLHFALDNILASRDDIIGDAQELAIFPPVTGG